MHEKTGHDNKGMSGHGFTFPVGGSVPVIFISMGFDNFFRRYIGKLFVLL
jgi:hypothetical protein